jgi:hypothetical protein
VASPDLGGQVFEFIARILCTRTGVGIFINRKVKPLILAELARDHQVFGVDFIDILANSGVYLVFFVFGPLERDSGDRPDSLFID